HCQPYPGYFLLPDRHSWGEQPPGRAGEPSCAREHRGTLEGDGSADWVDGDRKEWNPVLGRGRLEQIVQRQAGPEAGVAGWLGPLDRKVAFVAWPGLAGAVLGGVLDRPDYVRSLVTEELHLLHGWAGLGSGAHTGWQQKETSQAGIDRGALGGGG